MCGFYCCLIKTTESSSGDFHMFHVTRTLRMSHIVDIVQKCYPDEDESIVHTKAGFLKSPKHIWQFHTHYLNNSETLHPILT